MKQETFRLHKPAGISQPGVAVGVRRKQRADSESECFHLSHTFCGRAAGLLLLPVMKSVNYWPPAAALWISTLHSLCDLQRQQKYMIALTQTSKTRCWTLTWLQTELHFN